MMITRPGVMFYLEHKDCVDELDDAEAGQLMKGMLEYVLTGTLPQFHGALKLVWLMIKPRLDHDAERYFKMCRQKSYAVYCREQDRKGLERLSFAEWETDSSVSGDNCYDPTATTSATTTAATTTTATETATSSTAAAITLPPSDAPDGVAGGSTLEHFGPQKLIRMTGREYVELMDEIGLRELQDVLTDAEQLAVLRGYDTETIDWPQFIRFCAARGKRTEKNNL